MLYSFMYFEGMNIQIQEYTVIVSELAALPKDRVSCDVVALTSNILDLTNRACSRDKPVD